MVHLWMFSNVKLSRPMVAWLKNLALAQIHSMHKFTELQNFPSSTWHDGRKTVMSRVVELSLACTTHNLIGWFGKYLTCAGLPYINHLALLIIPTVSIYWSPASNSKATISRIHSSSEPMVWGCTTLSLSPLSSLEGGSGFQTNTMTCTLNLIQMHTYVHRYAQQLTFNCLAAKFLTTSWDTHHWHVTFSDMHKWPSNLLFSLRLNPKYSDSNRVWNSLEPRPPLKSWREFWVWD